MFDIFKPKLFDFNKQSETALTLTQFIQNTIDEFDLSETRRLMLDGENYYRGDNDIKNVKKYRYENDIKVEDPDKPNNKINHSFMKLAIDEKVGYFLGNPPTITSQNAKLQELATETFNENFDDLINDIAVEASNKGIAWLHVFIDEEGELSFMQVPAEQVIPLWKDIAHTKLDGIIRYYFVDTYIGTELKSIKKVEYWTEEGVIYFTETSEGLVVDVEIGNENSGDMLGHYLIGDSEESWGMIPFIPFKNNSYELPDLYFTKSIIDQYDKISSDNSNMLEEIQNVIYVLTNYGGTNLSEFIRDLNYYRAIKVDEDGGVEVLKSDLNIDSTEKTLDRLKKDFYQFGQGVDMDTDKFGSSPSGVALEFLYSKLKLKVNNMERKFKKSYKTLFKFICQYYQLTNQGVYNSEDLQVTFTRSAITNLTENIEAVNTSANLISKKTALAHHPWVEDVDLELENIEDETGEFDYSNFNTINSNQGNKGNVSTTNKKVE